MTALAASEASGWLIAVLTSITIALPYLLRGRRLAPDGWGVGYLERMSPHYWIGYTIAGLSLVHAGFAMSTSTDFSGSSGLGIWIATGAMLLALGQVSFGRQLKQLRGAGRLRLRRTHFLVMTGLVALGLVHLALNGPVVQGIAHSIALVRTWSDPSAGTGSTCVRGGRAGWDARRNHGFCARPGQRDRSSTRLPLLDAVSVAGRLGDGDAPQRRR